MNNSIKKITSSSELVTNLINDNFSLQWKIKSLKIKIVALKVTLRPSFKLFKTYPDLQIDIVKTLLPTKIR